MVFSFDAINQGDKKTRKNGVML